MRFIKILTSCLIIFSLAFTSCKSKLDQKSMFHGRSNKNKKGVYNTGLNRKKPISVQIAEEHDKLTKHDDNPKKAARKAEKEMEKKKRASQKKRAKANKKINRKRKIKTTKGKTGGDT